MWSNNNPNHPNSEPFFERSDDMLSFIFGMTPQVKLNEKWSVNSDLSFIFHVHQTTRFDMQAKNLHGAIDGYLLNLSVGITRYFGKNERHADWTKTQYAEGMDELKIRVQQLEEQSKDDDKDGVPNGMDAEPGTAEGSLVDSKGVGLKDSDNDGVADTHDYCPDVPGPFSTNGCADGDKDGVADQDDECPQTPGATQNKGCPILARETKEIMTKALKGVQFDYKENKLLPTSYPVLDAVVKEMAENPEYQLEINGFTDNIGEEADNIVLSQLRAQNVANYLYSKGVEISRIRVNGYGEAFPKATNDTPEGQAINRRVEFKIIFN
jgi:outer membrane protein OmpA-like peptidoglycan-associated protein